MQTNTQPIPSSVPTLHQPEPDKVEAALKRRSFATLATSSSAGIPHVAGVLYEIVGNHMFVNTMSSSRKARNVAANGRVAVCVPVRRLPVGPPSSVQFQARAEVLDLDDPAVADAIAGGALTTLTKHGELEIDGGCFLRIELPTRLLTYGLGMSLRSLIADPLAAAGNIHIEEWS